MGFAESSAKARRGFAEDSTKARRPDLGSWIFSLRGASAPRPEACSAVLRRGVRPVLWRSWAHTGRPVGVRERRRLSRLPAEPSGGINAPVRTCRLARPELASTVPAHTRVRLPGLIPLPMPRSRDAYPPARYPRLAASVGGPTPHAPCRSAQHRRGSMGQRSGSGDRRSARDGFPVRAVTGHPVSAESSTCLRGRSAIGQAVNDRSVSWSGSSRTRPRSRRSRIVGGTTGSGPSAIPSSLASGGITNVLHDTHVPPCEHEADRRRRPSANPESGEVVARWTAATGGASCRVRRSYGPSHASTLARGARAWLFPERGRTGSSQSRVPRPTAILLAADRDCPEPLTGFMSLRWGPRSR
jgi:hypothetical protein